MRLTRVVGAELVKIRTLPAAVATVVGTAVASAVLAGVAGLPTSVPLLQVGPVLLAVLAVASEYSGTQIRTTLTAVPDRTTALAGRTAAFLVVVTATSAAAGAAALLADPAAPAASVAGAAVHLVLVGLLAHAVALLLRALVPALVGTLVLLLVVGPLLAPVTEHARWLPDRAGQALYLPGPDAVLTPWTGGLVLVGWVAVAGAAATRAFLTRDA